MGEREGVVATKDEIVRGYAQALLAVAEAEEDLGTVEDELFAFAKTVERDARLREALTDPALPAENKRAVVKELLGDRANPHTVSILGFLIEQGRAKELGRILEGLAELAAERRKHVVAEVRSAVPLSQERRKKLAEALSKATGKNVEIKVVIDPAVIGGVLARVGDEVFDGTVRTRLEDARERLGSA
ncbi:MAG: ATP synthase F1 subunit delta [Actinobacteria bacterium]|nr:MAG: ATP synthase F1 subunit delta [Actinomycetota bacterium]